MKHLVNIVFGGFKDTTQYAVYDEETNTLDYYTETQVLSKAKKGLQVNGLYVDGNRVDVYNSRIITLPNIYSVRNNMFNVKYHARLAHNTVPSSYLHLQAPVKMGKLKTGSIFIYKNLYIRYDRNQGKDTQSFSISLFQSKSDTTPEQIVFPEYIRNIIEIVPYLGYNIHISLVAKTLKEVNLAPLVENLHLNSLILTGHLDECEYFTLGNTSNIQSISIANIIAQTTPCYLKYVDLTGLCSQINDNRTHNNYTSIFYITSNMNFISKPIFIFNSNYNAVEIENTVKHNFVKMVNLGKLPSYTNLMDAINVLKAKNILLIKQEQDIKGFYCFI